jgi:hypothetical protein
MTVCADDLGYVRESDEDNNWWDEGWYCEAAPPAATPGPQVPALAHLGASLFLTV